MSHVFISYSNRNYLYAYPLAEFLQKKGFDVWIDSTGIEYGVNWWNAIVRGLRESLAYVVVMTPESKASEWVMREVFLALNWKKPLFPLLLEGRNWELFVTTQYIDVRNGHMPDSEFLSRLSAYVTPHERVGKNTSTLDYELESEIKRNEAADFNMDEAITAFGQAYRARQWGEAMEILGRIRASGEDPSPFDPDELGRKVMIQLESDNHQREQARWTAERDETYGRLVQMADYTDRTQFWGHLQRFWEKFPDYDPEYLARYKPKPFQIPPDLILSILPPPFEWCQVEAGKIILGDGLGERLVEKCSIAKYPVTYEQFQVFVDDPNGFSNADWWKGLLVDENHRRKMGKAQFYGRDYPREHVSWYDAVAFCRWLSWQIAINHPSTLKGVKFDFLNPQTWAARLPQEAEWQAAAQGQTARQYPWGNEFDGHACNYNSSGTTPVTQFHKNESPCGANDLCGNVWEWTLCDFSVGEFTNLYSTNPKTLRGGSWREFLDDFLTTQARNMGKPDLREGNIGFRLATSF